LRKKESCKIVETLGRKTRHGQAGESWEMSLGFPMLARDRPVTGEEVDSRKLKVEGGKEKSNHSTPHPLIFVSLSFQIKLKSFALIDF
jgi:hypothetical protein